jgi:hypothetical protein
MKRKTALNRNDFIIALGCMVFLLMTLGAIGSSGRRRAKEVVCLSNLRKLGVAFQQFTADNNGYFQEGYLGMPGCWTSGWWMYVLKPHFENQDLCLCPEATIPGAEVGLFELGAKFHAWSAQGWLGPPGSIYGSYGINGWVENNRCEAESQTIKRRRWRTPNVAGAAHVPMLLDAAWIDGWPQHQNAPPAVDDQDVRYSNQMGRFCINRHSSFVNSVFLDFSARKVGLKELWTLNWHREYDTCGPWTRCGGIQPADWPEWMRNFQDY